MRIFGPPTLAAYQLTGALQGIPEVSPLFINTISLFLWDAASSYFIDPVGIVAQSLIETDYGRYTGKVQPNFFNTGGIKIYDQRMTFVGQPDPSPLIGDKPLAHQIFPNWRTGTLAHAQHLCAYAGRPVPEKELVDPRYPYVFGNHKLENWRELSNKWNSGSATYGDNIEAMMSRLKELSE